MYIHDQAASISTQIGQGKCPKRFVLLKAEFFLEGIIAIPSFVGGFEIFRVFDGTAIAEIG